MINIKKAQKLHIGEELHTNECKITIGPRGGRTSFIQRARVNGQVKVWKRSPGRFLIPMKYGLRDYFYITEFNGEQWHRASECNPRIIRKWKSVVGVEEKG